MKIRGGNIIPVPQNGYHWIDLWATWDWYGTIKPQIDATIAAGGNAVRITQEVAEVLGGTAIIGSTAPLSIGTLLARYTQLLNYCRLKGIYCYAAIGSGVEIVTLGFTSTQMLAVQGPVVSLLNQYQDVVFGIDYVDEVMSWVAATSATAVATYAAVVYPALKALTSIPLTMSCPNSTYNGLTSALFSDTATMATLDPYLDYYEFHLYYAPAINDIAPVLAATTKPILIGEAGSSATDTSASRTARFQAFQQLAARGEINGMFAWATFDQDTLPANCWGLYQSFVHSGSSVTYTASTMVDAAPYTTLAVPLSTGAPITALPVAALPGLAPNDGLPSGQVITLGSGANTQTWTLTAAVAAGATSLPVASQTPNFAYPSGSLVAANPDAFGPSLVTFQGAANSRGSVTQHYAVILGAGPHSFAIDFAATNTGGQLNGADTKAVMMFYPLT